MQHRKTTRVTAALVFLGVLCWGSVRTTGAHVWVFEWFRVGSYPPYDGSGWIAEAYFLPDEDAADLVPAEQYAEAHEPDFTFRTPWIDFPAGPVAFDVDTSFATVGDFLNDYIYDVSDPSKLDEPFGHLFLKFTGFLSVKLEDDVFPDFGLPVWVEFRTMGHDGYRTRLVNTVYRMRLTNPETGLFGENAIIEGLGLFPIKVTYFNRYDPDPKSDRRFAGVELYSWHGGGLPWPAGEQMVHPTRGPATIVPPRVIYQAEDILPLLKGDYDADYDVDLLDFGWFQYCFSTSDEGEADPTARLPLGCKSLDFEDDGDVDMDDYSAFQDAYTGPGGGEGGGE